MSMFPFDIKEVPTWGLMVIEHKLELEIENNDGRLTGDSSMYLDLAMDKLEEVRAVLDSRK